MKAIFCFLTAAVLTIPTVGRAQDPAVEERLNRLSAQIEDLIAAKEAQNRRIEALERELETARQQINKPNSNYATVGDVKQLAERMQEIDRKRQEDNALVLKQIENLGKTLSPIRVQPGGGGTGAGNAQTGYEYVVQSGDNLIAIAKAYTSQGIRVTADQIQKANPGLVPERMQVGQKIWIPASQ